MTDDDLRARLRRADPAAQLTPSTPDRIARMLENAMTTTTAATSTAPSRAPRRRPLIAVAAAALVLVATGVGLLLWQFPGRNGGPGSPTAGSTVTQLTLGGAQGKCGAPHAEILADSADFAFAGTVTGVKGQVMTLQVTHIYKGKDAAQVQVRQTNEASEQLVGSSSTFQQGHKYLIASSAGNVMICGYSGEADTPGLEQLYNQAF